MSEQKTILVVDDEPELRDMIQLRGQDYGFNVIMAENGAEALKKLRAERVDLIICDVLMPVMDGFAFYKEIKRNQTTANIPVLILTARGKMEDSFKVLGVDDFFAKPFDGKVLMDRVSAILSVERPVTEVETPVAPPPSQPVPLKKSAPAKPPGPEPVARSIFSTDSMPATGDVYLGADRKIFVAGTDADTVKAIADFLRKHKCQVETALSGQEVMLKADKFSPGLMILDVMMEDMDSAELIKALHSTDGVRSTTIVTYCFYRMSDLGSEDVREVSLSIDAASDRCQDEGAKEYLGRYNDGPFFKALERFL